MMVIILSSFIASFGFGIIFNIHGKKLVAAAFAGMLGSVVYTAMMNQGQDEVMSMLLASICFSIFSEVFARICHTPVTTFVICALIPLVPGKGMYMTMQEAVAGNTISALQEGLATLSKAGALALGIIAVSTLTRLIFRFQAIRKKHLLEEQ